MSARCSAAALKSESLRHAMRSLLVTFSLAVLAACTSVAPSGPAPEPAPAQAPPTPDQRAALPAQLAVEQKWLSSWFKGTPVRIRQLDDGALTIEVPREFCFDPGRSTVKPALAAVLDKTAESLRRLPQAEVALIAAPADASGNAAPLAVQRATQVREHLRTRGVQTARLGKPAVASIAAVQLRIDAPSL
jgi:outer membrane protein OmpA-like peptidoglycan-associated protein